MKMRGCLRFAFGAACWLPLAAALSAREVLRPHRPPASARRASGELFQRSRQTPTPQANLDSISEGLGTILDTVVGAWNNAEDALADVVTQCRTEVSTYLQRMNAMAAKNVSLENSRIANLALQSKLQTEINTLSAQEKDAQASFDSTVEQRAKEAHAYFDADDTRDVQRQMLSQVVDKMREKQAMMTRSSEVASANAPNVVVAGERYIFLRSSSYKYPGNCTQGVGVVVLRIDSAADPPIQVRWDSGFEYWIKQEDLREVTILSEANGPSSSFNTIVGIFQGMINSLDMGGTNDAQAHTEKDAELLKLVDSFKEQLQHIDGEYERIVVEQATAFQTASDAKSTMLVIGSMDREARKLLVQYQALCGFTGQTSDTGLVTEIVSRGNLLVDALKTKAEQALLLVNELSTVAAAASFTEIEQGAANGTQLVQPRASSLLAARRTLSSPPSATAPSQGGGRAAKWLLDAMARGLKPPAPVPVAAQAVRPLKRSRHLVDHNFEVTSSVGTPGVASSPPSLRGVAPSAVTKDPSSKALLGSFPDGLGVLNAAATGTASQGRATLAERVAVAQLPQNWQDCVDKKQALTAQIITARQEGRTARSRKAKGEVLVVTYNGLVDLFTTRQTQVFAERNELAQAFTKMKAIVDVDAFQTTLLDSLTQIGQVQSTVDAYMAADPPPAASALPVVISSVRATLNNLNADVTPALSSIYTMRQDLETNMASEYTRDGSARDAVLKVIDLTKSNNVVLNTTITQKDALEQDLMNQRMTLEAECEILLQGGVNKTTSP